MKDIGDKINGKRIISVGYLDGTDLFYDLEDGTTVLDKDLKKIEIAVDIK